MDWLEADWEWLAAAWTDETQRKVLISVVTFFLTTVLSFVVGRTWGRWKARSEWDHKHFLGRIIVSLNCFSKNNTLQIRTIFERSLEDVFINPLAVERVLTAAHKTKPGQPLLPIPPKDRWFILNFVLNAVAEEFNEGLIRYDAGEQVRPIKYLLCLTCEAVGDDRIRKVRAMMIQKDMLVYGLVDVPSPRTCKFEQPWHSVRLETLQHCREAYLQEPDNFLELEVYV